MSSPTGPTPPPPPPYPPTIDSAAAEAAGPGLSEPQRLINTFIAPSKTFEDLKRNSSWWMPWVVAAVFSLAFAIAAVPKLDMAHLVQQRIDRSPSAQRRLEQLTPEQRAQGMAVQATATKVTFYLYPLLILIGGLIIAAVLMAVFNFVLGAEVPFQRALAIVFYSFVPWNLATILLTVSVLVSSDPNTIDFAANPMPTNPAFFMDPQGNKVVYAILSSFDIFKIWLIVLLGLGFATASSNRKPTVRTATTTMFVIYAILVLAGVVWNALF